MRYGLLCLNLAFVLAGVLATSQSGATMTPAGAVGSQVHLPLVRAAVETPPEATPIPA